MKNIIQPLTCTLLILLFSYTAVSKLIDISGFAYDMHNQPFPRWFSSSLVWALPFFELLIVAMLFFDKSRYWGLLVSGVLMGLFTVYTCLVLLKVFSRVPCSCGGVIKKLNWREHLAFNIFFLILIVAAVKGRRTKHIHA